MNLTPRGRLFASAGVGLWLVALVRASVPAAAAAFLVTLVFAYALATLREPRAEVERRLPREKYSEQEEFELTTLVRTRGGGRVRTRERCSEGLDIIKGGEFESAGGEPTPRTMTIAARTWGAQVIGPTEVVVEDAWGVMQRSAEVGGTTPVLVLPAAQGVGKFRPRSSDPQSAMGGYSISRPGDSADFFALRDYQSGDSIRRINWKASAKAGKTIVNQVTRDSFARILLILDMRAKEGVGGRDAPRVHAGRAAASLLTYHERAKDHLQVLLVGSDATLASHESNPRLPDLLAAIASTAPGGDCSLAEAIRSHVHLVRPRTPVYLLTSGALDADLVEAAAMLSTLEARPWLIAPEWPALADDPAEARAARVSREHALAGARGAGTTVVEWDGQEMLEASLVHP